MAAQRDEAAGGDGGPVQYRCDALESGVSGPLKIAGRQFDRGLQVYAYSKVWLPLGGNFDRFEASIGIDDWVGKRKGHHHVQLDTEAWDRLTTWIDLNAPCHGTWSEAADRSTVGIRLPSRHGDAAGVRRLGQRFLGRRQRRR